MSTQRCSSSSPMLSHEVLASTSQRGFARVVFFCVSGSPMLHISPLISNRPRLLYVNKDINLLFSRGKSRMLPFLVVHRVADRNSTSSAEAVDPACKRSCGCSIALSCSVSGPDETARKYANTASPVYLCGDHELRIVGTNVTQRKIITDLL